MEFSSTQVERTQYKSSGWSSLVIAFVLSFGLTAGASTSDVCKIAFSNDIAFEELKPSPRSAGGSTGGVWKTDSTGTDWFVKTDVIYPELQTSAEVISSEVYRRLGYHTPLTMKVKEKGRFYSMARDVGKSVGYTNFSQLNTALARQLRLVAAYLKDWDRLGNSANSLSFADGSFALLDFGGTLGSRAQGNHKPGKVVSPAIGAFENTADFKVIYTDFYVSVPQDHPWNNISKSDQTELIEKFSSLLSNEVLAEIVTKAHYSDERDSTYMLEALKSRRDGIVNALRAGKL